LSYNPNISPQGGIRPLGGLDPRCGWPEAASARTGFAASSSLADAVSTGSVDV